MNTSLKQFIATIPKDHPLNDIGVFNNAMLSKGNDNMVTISIVCILDTSIADNINIEFIEDQRMYNDLIGKKILEIENTGLVTGNYLWHIREQILLEPHVRIVEARIKDGRSGKRGSRTIVQMATSDPETL